MKIKDWLLNEKAITEEQFLKAQENKKEKRVSFLEALLELPDIQETNILAVLAEFFKVDVIDLDQVTLDLRLMELLPERFMKERGVIPLAIDEEDCLTVVMHNPTDILLRDDLHQIMAYTIKPVLSSKPKIRKKLDEFFNLDQMDDVIDRVLEYSKNKIDLDDEIITSNSSIINADKSPIVSLVDSMISSAIKEKASDIHIEPLEKHIELRYRIDGVLREKMKLPKKVLNPIVSRLKVMSELNISEKRRPQDGRLKFKVMDKNVNLRISTIFTVHGEKIVMRILDSSEVNMDIKHLGMKVVHREMFTNMLKQPQGMILVSGPTGSGKTSTLYTAIKHLKSKSTNIITIEDPVEYTIEGINQTQTNPTIGYTFAQGLKTILRQDPDVILVGEMRDSDTANIGFRASLTGHLVLSTIHTNCSVSAITRLKDIGIEPFLISSSMLGVIAQRLVRVNCEHCLEEYEPMDVLMKKYQECIKTAKPTFMRGKGCKHCDMTGYKGRAAVFEILPFNKEIRELITEGVSEGEIRQEAYKYGFISLVQSGLLMAFEGKTTLEEMESIIGNYDNNHDNGSDADRPKRGAQVKMARRKKIVKESIQEEFQRFLSQMNNFL